MFWSCVNKYSIINSWYAFSTIMHTLWWLHLFFYDTCLQPHNNFALMGLGIVWLDGIQMDFVCLPLVWRLLNSKMSYTDKIATTDWWHQIVTSALCYEDKLHQTMTALMRHVSSDITTIKWLEVLCRQHQTSLHGCITNHYFKT